MSSDGLWCIPVALKAEIEAFRSYPLPKPARLRRLFYDMLEIARRDDAHDVPKNLSSRSALSAPLTPFERESLRGAGGQLVDERGRDWPMYRDLEIRGYLRRIVSFNPQHYVSDRPTDRPRGRDVQPPKYAWTRTELAESVLGRCHVGI